MWHDLALAFCLLLVIEGLLPALNPGAWKRIVLTLAEASERHVRAVGLALLFGGAILLYIIN